MLLLVGLGNPGPQYARTRHNAGWLVIDELARRTGIELQKRSADTKIGVGFYGSRKIALLKPQTFMNESGRSVSAMRHFYRVEVADILVFSDDLNLPLGRLRLRADGSDGGHNGLKSVAQSLGTPQFARLRFGVGAPDPNERAARGTAGYVLRPFAPDQWPLVDETVTRAADCALTWIEEGLGAAMNRFNS